MRFSKWYQVIVLASNKVNTVVLASTNNVQHTMVLKT